MADLPALLVVGSFHTGLLLVAIVGTGRNFVMARYLIGKWYLPCCEL